jgi:hypothetical protein
VPEVTGSEPEADRVCELSIGEPEMMLMEKRGPEGWVENEVTTDESVVAVEEPGVMGRAELAMDDEASYGGKTALGVEQIVVVVPTTVVDVRTTVALAGQSLALEHSVVYVNMEVTRTTAVVVSSRSRRAPTKMLEEVGYKH